MWVGHGFHKRAGSKLSCGVRYVATFNVTFLHYFVTLLHIRPAEPPVTGTMGLVEYIQLRHVEKTYEPLYYLAYSASSPIPAVHAY